MSKDKKEISSYRKDFPGGFEYQEENPDCLIQYDVGNPTKEDLERWEREVFKLSPEAEARLQKRINEHMREFREKR